jgi:uncharacterized protein (TIGR02265 family)
VRGLYLGSVEAVLERAGQGAAYRSLFPQRFTAIRWYPMSELLVRIAVGGALLSGPERVHDGMFEIGRRNAIAFAESLLGRMLFRLLSRDPHKLLQQAVAGRRQSYNYGSWTLSFPEERKAVMHMTEEYLYIESYQLGAARGTFDAIGLPVSTEVVLETRFSGSHILVW